MKQKCFILVLLFTTICNCVRHNKWICECCAQSICWNGFDFLWLWVQSTKNHLLSNCTFCVVEILRRFFFYLPLNIKLAFFSLHFIELCLRFRSYFFFFFVWQQFATISCHCHRPLTFSSCVDLSRIVKTSRTRFSTFCGSRKVYIGLPEVCRLKSTCNLQF